MKKTYSKEFTNYHYLVRYYNKLKNDKRIDTDWYVGNEMTIYWLYK